MKIRKYFLITGLIGLLIFSYVICFAADDKAFTSKKDIQKFCDTVVSDLKNNKVNDAFDMIRNKWIFSDSEITTLQRTTIQQLDLVKSRFGDTLDYKLIKVDEIEDVGLRYTYIIKYEKHITRWIFIFYKPNDNWYLNTLTWDDKLVELFDK